jgi:hypothetical protein
VFPTCDSNLQADALAREVLVHYPIGEITRCRFHARGLNDTYKVETSSGESYFLRIYRAGWRLQFSTSYLFQIWSLFRTSHPSMSLSKGLPQSQRLPRV